MPSGLHHLYIAPGPQSDFSPRAGLWFHATGAPGSVIALKWSDQEEQLVQATEQDLQEKGEWVKWWYDGSLVEYRARGGSGVQEVGEARVWKALVGEVGEGTLARVTGSPEESAELCGPIAGEMPQKVKIWRVESASSAAQDRDDEILSKIKLPQGIGNTRMNTGKSKDHDQTLNILPVDLKRTFPPTATGRERTLAAQDRSWYLSHLISTHLVPHAHPPPPTCIVQLDPGSREVLGELEFAFIHALTLANYSCSQAYMRILTICLTCEERILTKPGFYHRLIEVLITELGVGLDCFAPPDVTMDDDLGDVEGHQEAEAWAPDWLTEGPNPLPKLLRRFLRTLKRLLEEVELAQHTETLEELLTRLGRLETVVESRFGWVIDTSKVVKKGLVQLEDGEMVELEMTALLEEEEEEEGEGPVVVEL